MPRDVSLSTASTRIDECIDSTRDELQETEKNDNGTKIEWIVERGDYIYTVQHVEDADYFEVTFGYDIRNTVAQIISEEDAERVLRGADGRNIPDDKMKKMLKAAEVLLENASQNVQNQFANDLIQLMSHPGLGFEFQGTEGGALAVLQLKEFIYPYSDEFQFSEFNEAVQTVVTVGHAAITYVQVALDVQAALDAQKPEAPVNYIQ